MNERLPLPHQHVFLVCNLAVTIDIPQCTNVGPQARQEPLNQRSDTLRPRRVSSVGRVMVDDGVEAGNGNKRHVVVLHVLHRIEHRLTAYTVKERVEPSRVITLIEREHWDGLSLHGFLVNVHHACEEHIGESVRRK